MTTLYYSIGFIFLYLELLTIISGNKKLNKFITNLKSLNDKEKKEYIEYEKPPLLKRPDGSVISELGEGVEVILITHYYQLEKLVYAKYLYQDLKKGLIFLPEDEHLAEKKAAMLTKQLEIQFEIDKLKAEDINYEDAGIRYVEKFSSNPKEPKIEFNENESCKEIPARQGYYYYIDSDSLVEKTCFGTTRADKYRLAKHNVFLDQETAEKVLEKELKDLGII